MKAVEVWFWSSAGVVNSSVAAALAWIMSTPGEAGVAGASAYVSGWCFGQLVDSHE